MVLTAQFVCSTIGLVALSFVLLSYESEEALLRNWLEDIWLAVADVDVSISERILRALQMIGRSAKWVLTRLYGPEIISFRAYVTSLSLCIGFGLVVGTIGRWTSPEPFVPGLWELYVPLFIWPLEGAVLLVAPFVANQMISYLVSFVTVTFAYFSVLVPLGTYDFVLDLGISSILDFIGIALTRAIIDSMIRATSLSVVIRYTAFSVIPAILLVAIPYVAADVINIVIGLPGGVDDVIGASVSVWLFNSVAILTCLSLILIALLAVLYRAVWSLIPRAVYVPLKFDVFRSRRVIGSMGAALVLAPWSPILTAVERLVAAIF